MTITEEINRLFDEVSASKLGKILGDPVEGKGFMLNNIAWEAFKIILISKYSSMPKSLNIKTSDDNDKWKGQDGD